MIINMQRHKSEVVSSTAVAPMTPKEVEERLWGLKPEQRRKTIDSVPYSAWTKKSVIPRHKEVSSAYFGGDSKSITRFARSYSRHTGRDLSSSAATNIINQVLQKSSQEPSVRQMILDYERENQVGEAVDTMKPMDL